MSTKQRDIRPAKAPPQLPADINRPRDDYDQLLKVCQDFLGQHAVKLVLYGEMWAVSHQGKREFFYGAGDAFAYAVGLLPKLPPPGVYPSLVERTSFDE